MSQQAVQFPTNIATGQARHPNNMPSHSSNSYSPIRSHPPSQSPSRHNARPSMPWPMPSSSDSSLRPRMQRLDTIHSMASDSGPPTGSLKIGVSRKPSRAERSAAINIQRAKERGWRGTVKKRKQKERNQELENGESWTDVPSKPMNKDRKGTKCIVMWNIPRTIASLRHWIMI